jgi:hypothetical protein
MTDAIDLDHLDSQFERVLAEQWIAAQSPPQ